MGPQRREFYNFGPFRIDVADRVLTLDQQVIPLNLKTFQILLALIENAGRVLTKDMLMKRIWPDTFVEEGNLTKGIFSLRKILGEKPGGGSYIETLPKRGYRFVAEVTASPDPDRGDIVVAESGVRSALPAPRNSFVGRQEDLSGLTQRLLAQNIRLLTLTGCGGTGKTRLALEVAAGVRTEFTGGVHFIALSSVTDSGGVISAIARSFRFFNSGDRFFAGVLGKQLELSLQAPTLLVLDNFEHLLPAGALVADLLDDCHQLKILVTSRVVLHVYGEHEYPLAPLPVPDLEYLPPPDVLLHNPAVALFLERVAAVKPDFTLTEDNKSDVAGICARLDGLPLAIELAAVRMKVLPAASLLARLQARLKVLTGGPLDAPERQQTLRKTIDWSYELLSLAQQRLFRRLSVFSGGFTPESTEAVCNPRLDLEMDVLDGTCSLLDHNLLQRSEAPHGQIRFTMLETVREYGLERLRLSGEEEFTRRAHAAYCLVLAEEGNSRVTPAERESWLAMCNAEHDNLRAGLAWLVEKQLSEWALRMALALFVFWESREYLAEGYQSLQAALRLPGSADRTRVRAGALWRTGAMLGFQGDFEGGWQLHREALDIYLEVGNTGEIAFQMSALGACQMLTGDYAGAVLWYEQSLLVYRELGGRTEIAQALSNLAQAHNGYGDHVLASSRLHEALTMFRDLEQWDHVGWSLNHLGDVARTRRDLREARHLYQQGADVFRQHDDAWGLARSLIDIADVCSEESDHSTAHELLQQALQMFLKLEHKRGVARTFEGLASNAARQGSSPRALILAGCAAGLRDRTGARTRPCDKPGLDRALAPAWESVDSVAARDAWISGWRMPLEQAVLFALSQEDSVASA